MSSLDVDNTILKFTFDNRTPHSLGSGEFRDGDFPASLKTSLIEDITADIRDGIVKVARGTSTNISSDCVVSPCI